MIFGHINKIIEQRYRKPLLKAFEFLKHTDIASLAPGKHEIEGDKIYAQVVDITTKEREEIPVEVHRKYVDVQYLHSGAELIGVSPDLGNNELSAEYDEKIDMTFYKDMHNEQFLHMQPGNFAVFFPEDAHRPGIVCGQPMQIRKVIVKISVHEFK